MKEDGQSTQIYELPQTVVDHFNSSSQGYHLAFWQQGQRSWRQYSKEERKMDSANPQCPETASSKSNCKQAYGLRPRHGIINQFIHRSTLSVQSLRVGCPLHVTYPELTNKIKMTCIKWTWRKFSKAVLTLLHFHF